MDQGPDNGLVKGGTVGHAGQPILGVHQVRLAQLFSLLADRVLQISHAVLGPEQLGPQLAAGVSQLTHVAIELRAKGKERLGVLGLRRSSPDGGAPGRPLVGPGFVTAPAASGEGFVLEYFASLRSPYTAIVTPRVFEFAERSGVDLLVRPVLPMVMRGLAVPRAKRMYILRDTAREARRVGVPFGRVSDPLGRPVERALSLHDWARGQGREREYLLAFYDLVWAHGVDAGSDAGLRRIVERAGLPWQGACSVVDNDDWRGEVEQNRVDMMAAGCWGVPSFRLSGPGLAEPFVTWGQDRLWLIERALTGLS